MSKVFIHEEDEGIIEFHTDNNGNTTAICRLCGTDLTDSIRMEYRRDKA